MRVRPSEHIPEGASAGGRKGGETKECGDSSHHGARQNERGALAGIGSAAGYRERKASRSTVVILSLVCMESDSNGTATCGVKI